MTADSAANLSPVEDDGLLFGCTLVGDGTADLIEWRDVENWAEDDPPLWVHLDRNSPRVQHWLMHESGLTQPTTDALLAEETRPRVFHGKQGFVTIVRGINTNQGAEPTDMVAMRMWSDGKRVITIRQERLVTPRDVLAELLEHGTGPKTAAEIYERLIHRITVKIADSVESLEGALDEIEEKPDLARANERRRQLADLRTRTTILRRYLLPQREALNTLLNEPPTWFGTECRMRLRESVDRLYRYLEEIDSARDRASSIKDDIANQLAESSNRTLYILAIISAIFLPLGFLTGLLGVNIAGMPGVDHPYAFWIFCVMMVAMLVIELAIFKRLKWL